MNGTGFEPRDLATAAVEALRRDGRPVVVPIVGRSMRPTLAEGDAVLIAAIPGRLGRGDLVLARDATGLIVHRHVGRPRFPKPGVTIVCRGDGREDLDPPFDAAEILGRARALRRNGTWRGLESPAARLYARAVATHAIFWSGAIARFGGAAPSPLRRVLGRIDRALLRAMDGALFRVMHRRIAPPGGCGEAP